MPQNPNQVYPAVSSGVAKPLNTDAVGLLLNSQGGANAVQVTAAAVIKATPGRIAKIIILAPGSTSGAFTFNNCATTGAASSGNQIFTLAYNATANVAGAIFTVEIPCGTGIVCSAVPGGGSPVALVTYT